MSSLFVPVVSSLLNWSARIDWQPVPKSTETILLVMRHGETYGNDSKDPQTYTYTGCNTDYSLNENGKKQVNRVAEKMVDLVRNGEIQLSAIYSSPLTRAKESVQLLAGSLGLAVEVVHNLREINWGDADGQLVADFDKLDAAEEEVNNRTDLIRQQKWDLLPVIPNAEKFNQVLQRVMPELQKIAAQHPGQVVLIATHGRVVKTLTAEALNKNDDEVPYPKNAGIAVFRLKKDAPLEFVEIRDNQ